MHLVDLSTQVQMCQQESNTSATSSQRQSSFTSDFKILHDMELEPRMQRQKMNTLPVL